MQKRNLYAHMMQHLRNKAANKKSTPRTFDRSQYFCETHNREIANRKTTFNCTHDPRYLQADINNELSGKNVATDAVQSNRDREIVDRMTVKIGLITENRANQIIPLYELNIPAMHCNPTAIDIRNSKRAVANQERNIEPAILVQAFTTLLNSTIDNSIKPNVTVSNRGTDSIRTFCHSNNPEIIVIDDSSDDCEMLD